MTDATSPQQIHRLYARHHGWLFGWLCRRLGCSSDAADIAQDTFVRLLDNPRGADPGPEPRALLTHIAKGLVIDKWRRQAVARAYHQAMQHLPPNSAPSAEEGLILLETLLRVDAALSGLPTATRRVFLMAQLDGLTLQEISVTMQMPVITVRRHVRKALVACMLAGDIA